MLGAKKRRTGGLSSREVVMSARAKKLEMAKTVPSNIIQWLEVVAKSRNTTPEFLLLSAIPAAACIMGPKSAVAVRPTYSEPLNLFGIVLSAPGSGKSQAFQLAVTNPLANLDNPTPRILVGDHTRSGLAKHLVENDGVALIASDELGSFLTNLCKKKREDQEERALLNKLYDRKYDDGSYVYEYGNRRIEIDASRLCITGFSQDEEFVQQFLDLSSRKDGFVDRLLFAVPEPHLLKNDEVDEWAGKLNNFRVSDFCDIYREIYELRYKTDENIIYTLSNEARQAYNQYSDEIITQLNSSFGAVEEAIDVSSKDGRTVLRLAGTLHVLYTVVGSALTNSNFGQGQLEMEKEINVATMKYAIALTDYYKEQRSIFVEASKGIVGPKAISASALKKAIALHPGPCVTIRNLMWSLSSSQRPDCDVVMEAMEALQEDQIGLLAQGPNNTSVFLKVKPLDIQNDEIAMKAIESLTKYEMYESQFGTRDMNLKDTYFKQLLRLHPNQDELMTLFKL